MIANALNDKKLPVYGEGKNVRDWLYVEDHCKAIDMILHEGKVGEVYNDQKYDSLRPCKYADRDQRNNGRDKVGKQQIS